MKIGEKIEKNQIIRIVLIMSIIVTSILTIAVVVNNRTAFDNDKVYGDFSGEIIFDSPAGLRFSLNITFDGKRSFEGSIKIDEDIYEISSTYTCVTSSIDFSFTVDAFDYFFSCEGIINDTGTIIQGNVRFYETSSDIYNGTIFVSKHI